MVKGSWEATVSPPPLPFNSFSLSDTPYLPNAPEEDWRGQREEAFPSPLERRGDVAILRLTGVLIKGASTHSGACSTQEVRERVKWAQKAPEIHGILLVVDSPGGEVSGVHDLALALKQFAQNKPLVTYIEDYGCSAAYWVACAAPHLFCNPTATVGGVGAMLAFTDSSQALERAGLRRHIITTGRHKRIGFPGLPLLPEDKAILRQYVGAIGAMFARFVLQQRRLAEVEAKNVFQGKLYVGEQAVAAGLVDGVMSFDEALQYLQNLIAMHTFRSGVPNRFGFKQRERIRKAMNLGATMRQLLAFGNHPIPGEEDEEQDKIGKTLLEQREEVSAETALALQKLLEMARASKPSNEEAESSSGGWASLLKELGIGSLTELRQRLELARVGREALEEARAEAKRAAVRLYGAEQGETIGAQVDFDPFEVVRAKAAAWNLESEARLGIGAQGAKRLSVPTPALGGEEASPPSAWERLTGAQRAMAQKMGFNSPEKREAFAENLLQAME